MRSNEIKGMSGVEYFIVIILLISFFIIAVVIASSVFHFALLPAGIISSGTGNPVPCTINITNVSTAGHYFFKISVSDGSLGLLYKVYINNVDSSDPSKIELVGNYSVGINAFSENITIYDPEENTVVIGNTTGSNVSVDGVKYKAGGECENEIPGA